MILPKKITIALTAWASVCLLMVGDSGIELYGILLLIGVLISRELSSVYISPEIGERMDVFIYVGIIFFIAVVARRVLEILGFF